MLKIIESGDKGFLVAREGVVTLITYPHLTARMIAQTCKTYRLFRWVSGIEGFLLSILPLQAASYVETDLERAVAEDDALIEKGMRVHVEQEYLENRMETSGVESIGGSDLLTRIDLVLASISEKIPKRHWKDALFLRIWPIVLSGVVAVTTISPDLRITVLIAAAGLSLTVIAVIVVLLRKRG